MRTCQYLRVLPGKDPIEFMWRNVGMAMPCMPGEVNQEEEDRDLVRQGETLSPVIVGVYQQGNSCSLKKVQVEWSVCFYILVCDSYPIRVILIFLTGIHVHCWVRLHYSPPWVAI